MVIFQVMVSSFLTTSPSAFSAEGKSNNLQTRTGGSRGSGLIDRGGSLGQNRLGRTFFDNNGTLGEADGYE